ncbi:MAG: hypothetical protein J3K34DRAFT_427637 [Monoraphidium minutum]|nr:MAG: hypothetical protein J3K34DRAFT_427637 [Monoraphidium minutum]
MWRQRQLHPIVLCYLYMVCAAAAAVWRPQGSCGARRLGGLRAASSAWETLAGRLAAAGRPAGGWASGAASRLHSAAFFLHLGGLARHARLHLGLLASACTQFLPPPAACAERAPPAGATRFRGVAQEAL